MEIHGSPLCWSASTSMSQCESIIWIHLVCTPLCQTWPSCFLKKKRRKERNRMACIILPRILLSYIFFCVELRSRVVVQYWPNFLLLCHVRLKTRHIKSVHFKALIQDNYNREWFWVSVRTVSWWSKPPPLHVPALRWRGETSADQISIWRKSMQVPAWAAVNCQFSLTST